MQMIKEYETANNIRYSWVARVRPDNQFSELQYAAVRKATAATMATAGTEGRVWFRAGGGSDTFAVMTRAALDGAYACRVSCPHASGPSATCTAPVCYRPWLTPTLLPPCFRCC